MNIKPNIGILNALIRITIGLTILSWSTAKLVKFPWRDSYLFMALCGAMKVAEGIVRYCPMTAFFQRCPIMTGEYTDANAPKGTDVTTNLDVDMPYNPT
jgi:predicted ATPase